MSSSRMLQPSESMLLANKSCLPVKDLMPTSRHLVAGSPSAPANDAVNQRAVLRVVWIEELIGVQNNAEN